MDYCVNKVFVAVLSLVSLFGVGLFFLVVMNLVAKVWNNIKRKEFTWFIGAYVLFLCFVPLVFSIPYVHDWVDNYISHLECLIT